jgi:acyl dehydratase
MWGEYHEGAKYEWGFRVSERDMHLFASLSGDNNPLHIDLAFAQAKGHLGKVIYGVLLASQVSRLIGEKMPDQHAILTSINLYFLRSAIVEEDLTFRAELTTKSDSTNSIILKCHISNTLGVICRGDIQAVWRG